MTVVNNEAFNRVLAETAARLEQTFNGDATGDDREISFILAVWERQDAEKVKAAMVVNTTKAHEVIAVLLDVIANYKLQHAHDAGHA